MGRAKGTQPVLALAPEDWFWATWRKLEPLPRPASPGFDLQSVLERLARVPDPPFYADEWSWSRARIPLSPAPEEAAFWLHAMLEADRELPPEKLAARWKRKRPPLSITLEEVARALPRRKTYLAPELWVPLVALFPVTAVMERMLAYWEGLAAQQSASSGWYHLGVCAALAQGFREFVVPYVSADEREALRELVRPRLDLRAWPAAPHEPVPLPISFAAALGFHAELRTLVESWSVQSSDEYHGQALDMVFSLGSAELVETHARRLKLLPRRGEHARRWLAHTEFRALGWVRDGILAQRTKSAATGLIGALGTARGPETVPYMVEAVLKSRAPDAARAWLERYPEHSIRGLAEVAAGRGKAAEAALDVLRTLIRKGHEAEVRSAVEEMGADRVQAALLGRKEEAYTPLDGASGWFDEAAPGLSPADRPAWVGAAELPPVTLGAQRLSDAQVDLLLAALRKSTLEAPHPLVLAVRERADRLALEQFVGRLHDLWQQHGMKLKENWAFAACGLLGGDGLALRLGPLARTLREQQKHQHAALALACLNAIGTDTALLQIRNFTRIPREWSLKETAEGYLKAAAERRGLTMIELEDRMVPDCGLDERGSCTFDFGPRRFTFALGPGLKPLVRDEAGKTRPDLPKPGSKDDTPSAEAATAAWKLLKKQLADVFKLQTRRLEQAMVTARRWSPADFETVLARHPVMTHLARGLVWGCYDAEGRLTATFRLAEDQSYADADDETFALNGAISLGIAHPLHLSEALRARWGERLSDYEITPPFPQVGRPVHAPTEAERQERECRRFAGVPCMAIALVDGLERRGWLRDGAGDGGCLCGHYRHFPAAGAQGTTAYVEYWPGAPVWDLLNADEQKVQHAWFVPGLDPERAWKETDRIPLGQVDRIVFSEVVADLAALTAHAR
jgi:hypothetical protein